MIGTGARGSRDVVVNQDLEGTIRECSALNPELDDATDQCITVDAPTNTITRQSFIAKRHRERGGTTLADGYLEPIIRGSRTMRLAINSNKVRFELAVFDSGAEQLGTRAGIRIETVNLVGPQPVARDSGTGAPDLNVAGFLLAMHYYI